MYDQRKVEDAVLALMHLSAFEDTFGWSTWKTFPWAATDGPHDRGLISDPRSKAKSVALTEEGARLAAELFERLFAEDDSPGDV